MSDSDDDWFNKDEDKIVEEFKKKDEIRKASEGPELIKSSRNEDDIFLEEQRLKQAANSDNTSKISTAELRKLAKLEPLEKFLVVATSENYSLGQLVCTSDSADRVLLYLGILADIINIQLPGFQEKILQSISGASSFMDQIRTIAIKMFNKKYKSFWLTAKYDVEKVFDDLMRLFKQLSWHKMLKPEARTCLQHIKKLILAKDSSEFAKNRICERFVKEIDSWLNDSLEEQTAILDDICPTMADVQCSDSSVIQKSETPNGTGHQTVAEYLKHQADLLRDDFLGPLRKCFKAIRKRNLSSLEAMQHLKLYNDVKIVVNKQFLDARRHEFVLVDVLGTRRSECNTPEDIKACLRVQKLDFSNVKNGDLFCLFTSEDLDNLVLVTVSSIDSDLLEAGYIGVNILRQYNIGDIYRQQFLMFETPAFFEPYRYVYNHLIRCDPAEMPMKDYIVFNKHDVQSPSYLTESSSYTYRGKQFHPLTEELPAEVLSLNDSQREAYRAALSQELALIHGPPGTGKTHLSVQLVETLLQNAKKPIILITYTNDSLDKFLIKLSSFTNDIVRFGSQTRQPAIEQFNIRDYFEKEALPQRLRKLYYLVNLEYKGAFQSLQDMHAQFDGSEESYQQIVKAQEALQGVALKIQTLRHISQYYAARSKGIIAMTTTCASRLNFLFRLLQSAVVVFEEAAEIHESHVVACLTPFIRHVIMIGDHLQLKPFAAKFHFGIGTNDLQVSLFERLISKTNVKPALLSVQYRMRKEIADLICPAIYERLETHLLEDYPNVQGMTENLYFYSHAHWECRGKEDSSMNNEFEVKECAKLIEYLMKQNQYKTSDIVALSPYANQVYSLSARISSNRLTKGIRVSTVDRFQGLEAKVVVLSLVRSNKYRQIGFLKEPNRVCVALSRAQHALYMIGNMQLLANNSSIWHAVKDKLESRNLIGTDFPYEPNSSQTA